MYKIRQFPVSAGWFRYLLLLGWVLPAEAQYGLELVAHLPYGRDANDVWHYTASDGTDFVLVGLEDGVSVVSLADPALPVEVQFVPGALSTWRDIKVWGNHAYVTADQAGTQEGLLVIDLTDAPDHITWKRWRPLLPSAVDTLATCHNLWIDEEGFGYLAGCNVNQGGILFLDLASVPGEPQFVGYNTPVYAHDCFVRNQRLFTAEIYAGSFGVYDVADKTDPVLLATQETPFRFCHNVWSDGANQLLLTTDERPDAPTAAYDVTDLGNIRLLDEFRPAATLRSGVIPHNVHVDGSFAVISHYGEGCVVLDISRPQNLVAVGHFDTSPDFVSGFHGAWGADPFLANGLIAVTDIEQGLYILSPTFQAACYLEGLVRDADSGTGIPGASVRVLHPEPNQAVSAADGQFRTGVAQSGTFVVSISAKGYFDGSYTVSLDHGEVTELTADLTPLPLFRVSGTAVDSIGGQTLPGTQILLENDDFSHSAASDAAGRFLLPSVRQGDYRLSVGRWGWRYLSDTLRITADRDLSLPLPPGYEDHFELNLGWTVSGDARSGVWERGVPAGLFQANTQWRPDGDSPADPGIRAWVTGNGGTTIFDDQVDDGTTRLESPAMSLKTRYNRPLFTFDYWYLNATSNNLPDDTLSVVITNGRSEKIMATYAGKEGSVSSWTRADTFDIAAWLPLTDSVRIRFQASDRAETPNVVEAGIDHFRLWEGLPQQAFPVRDPIAYWRAYPNPFQSELTIDYKLGGGEENGTFLLYNGLGQLVRDIPVASAAGTLRLSEDLPAGLYLAAIRTAVGLSKALPMLRMQ
jgi:choice-of-anchor B domain-containing protein